MTHNALPKETPRAPVLDPASSSSRRLLHRLMESWRARPDYYGELLGQHPEIDPEVVMKVA